MGQVASIAPGELQLSYDGGDRVVVRWVTLGMGTFVFRFHGGSVCNRPDLRLVCRLAAFMLTVSFGTRALDIEGPRGLVSFVTFVTSLINII